MATGYAAAVSGAADVAKIYPSYTAKLCGQAVTTYCNEAYAELYKLVWERCRSEGYDVTQIADGEAVTNLARVEAFLALAKIWEANALPAGGSVQDALALAKHYHARALDQFRHVRWAYDSTITYPTETDTYQKGADAWFKRG